MSRLVKSKEIDSDNDHNNDEDSVINNKKSNIIKNNKKRNHSLVNSSINSLAINNNNNHNEFERLITYDDDNTAEYQYSSFDPPSEKEVERWELIPKVDRNRIVNTIVRLFVMKGSRNEPISRSHVIDALNNLDITFKKHTSAILFKVQLRLREQFGYLLSTSDSIIGNYEGKHDEYILTNELKNKKLLEILSNQLQSSMAYRGFVYIVCQIIFISANHSIIAKQLLKSLRDYDNRFPESFISNKRKASSVNGLAIPELGDDFIGLMNRMKKEGYITITKDEIDTEDINKDLYQLSTRFYSEIGKIQLTKSYFILHNETPNEFVMKSLKDENDKFIRDKFTDDDGNAETNKNSNNNSSNNKITTSASSQANNENIVNNSSKSIVKSEVISQNKKSKRT